MKKVVIFGGGSGLSRLLKGIIQFPMDVTAVVSVSDNGASTGKLREEFAIPVVGDITKALLAKSEGKDSVEIDEEKISKKGIQLIAEKLFKVEDGYVRHNSLKTAYLIFSYLMEGE